MGSEKVVLPKRRKEVQQFVKNVLRDTQALEKMLYDGMFDTENMHIGAEQEFNIVDRHFRPLGINLDVLKKVDDPLFTTELAQFNMECNVPPVPFKGSCLSDMENTIRGLLLKVKKLLNEEFDAELILMGILPTIRKFNLEMDSITPIERYKALMTAILKLRGTDNTELKISGIDELNTIHSSPLLEAANTGFQVHLQVRPDEFVQKYNFAQAIAGPALATATNSPLLFGKRLWKETRIALFQQSVDTRTSRHNLRDKSPRVMFGNDWVRKTILEIYREDVMRFRTMLRNTDQEDSLEKLEKGIIPDLEALQIHNSTVYRWNRPCYGNAGEKPHLRIENRVLPAGPTVTDEMANAALWLGLLNGMGNHYKDITKVMDFDQAKTNFERACRYGIDATFTWIGGKKISTSDLLCKELIPIAREGLKKNKVNKADIDKYMDIIEGRCKTGHSPSQWMLSSYSKLTKETTKDEAIIAITASTMKNQITAKPCHEWDLASVKDLAGWQYSSLSVEEFMTTDLFTVQKDDIIELVAEMMISRKLRYVLVEDEKGNLEGLCTSRELMKHYFKKHLWKSDNPILAKDLMIKNPVTIEPHKGIQEALNLMRENEIGCLPVVHNKELMGVVTEQNFLNVTGRLINRMFPA